MSLTWLIYVYGPHLCTSERLPGSDKARLDVPWLWNVHAESMSSLHNGHLELSTRCGPDCPTCYIYICLKVGERDVSERTRLGGRERGGRAGVAEYLMRIGILSCCFQEMLRSEAYDLLG